MAEAAKHETSKGDVFAVPLFLGLVICFGLAGEPAGIAWCLTDESSRPHKDGERLVSLLGIALSVAASFAPFLGFRIRDGFSHSVRSVRTWYAAEASQPPLDDTLRPPNWDELSVQGFYLGLGFLSQTIAVGIVAWKSWDPPSWMSSEELEHFKLYGILCAVGAVACAAPLIHWFFWLQEHVEHKRDAKAAAAHAEQMRHEAVARQLLESTRETARRQQERADAERQRIMAAEEAERRRKEALRAEEAERVLRLEEEKKTRLVRFMQWRDEQIKLLEDTIKDPGELGIAIGEFSMHAQKLFAETLGGVRP